MTLPMMHLGAALAIRSFGDLCLCRFVWTQVLHFAFLRSVCHRRLTLALGIVWYGVERSEVYAGESGPALVKSPYYRVLRTRRVRTMEEA
jgi:hypothetical protein